MVSVDIGYGLVSEHESMQLFQLIKSSFSNNGFKELT